jgi:predicted RNA-binding protein with RPS1 domain
MQEDPWTTVIPANYRPGMVVKGHVTKIANFGVFVELEPGLEGLLHISEISDQKVEKPEDQLKVGQDLEVKILRVDSDERKIGLSLKRAQWAAGRRGAKKPARSEPKNAAFAAVWKAAKRPAAWATFSSRTTSKRLVSTCHCSRILPPDGRILRLGKAAGEARMTKPEFRIEPE